VIEAVAGQPIRSTARAPLWKVITEPVLLRNCCHETALNDSRDRIHRPAVQRQNRAIAKYLSNRRGVGSRTIKLPNSQLDAPEVNAETRSMFGQIDPVPDGSSPSRQRIADLVFGDDDRVSCEMTTESIIHPRTRAVITPPSFQSKADNGPVLILDVPLLLESHWETNADDVWVFSVSLPPSCHFASPSRVGTRRNFGPRQIPSITMDEKNRRRKRWVIENNGTTRRTAIEKTSETRSNHPLIRCPKPMEPF